MLLWSYFAVVFTDPGGVPQGWKPSSCEDDLEAQSLPLDPTLATTTVPVSLSTMAQSANVRYCRKCCQYKPPRCHHCSVCKFIFLKSCRPITCFWDCQCWLDSIDSIVYSILFWLSLIVICQTRSVWAYKSMGSWIWSFTALNLSVFPAAIVF
jgi:hypothetical protein